MAIAPTSLPPRPPKPSPAIAEEAPPARPPAPWRWMALACVLLAASGAVRLTQERRFGAADRGASTPPFPLKELPKELGDDDMDRWVMRGEELKLDAETQQIAGSVDYIARRYINEGTGVELEALVVFGPAERVFPHSPIVCFPSSGFSPVDRPIRHLIPGRSAPAAFDSLIYARETDAASRTEVFYSFWHDGQWSPTAAGTSKRFRHAPAMFKVQVQRPVGATEKRRAASGTDRDRTPIEDFLARLVPEIERRIAAAAEAPAVSASPAAEAPAVSASPS